jgi:hypothetical protein
VEDDDRLDLLLASLGNAISRSLGTSASTETMLDRQFQTGRFDIPARGQCPNSEAFVLI